VALAAGADCEEGVAAFLQHRSPRFTSADSAQSLTSPR
jgi:hypothetical protein